MADDRRPLLVLRPEPGASATEAAAEALGLEAIKAPLFTLRAIEPDLSGMAMPDALLLTSASAARLSGDWIAPYRHLPVYAVGAATAAAARRIGLDPVAVGEADAAAIVAQAAADGVRRLLHLAAREHRAVAHPAVAIERTIVYAADPVPALPPQALAALERGAVALLHSPRAAALFAQLHPRPRTRTAIAALSPAIAAAAGEGWRACAIAEHPRDDALLTAARPLTR